MAVVYKVSDFLFESMFRKHGYQSHNEKQDTDRPEDDKKIVVTEKPDSKATCKHYCYASDDPGYSMALVY